MIPTYVVALMEKYDRLLAERNANPEVGHLFQSELDLIDRELDRILRSGKSDAKRRSV